MKFYIRWFFITFFSLIIPCYLLIMLVLLLPDYFSVPYPLTFFYLATFTSFPVSLIVPLLFRRAISLSGNSTEVRTTFLDKDIQKGRTYFIMKWFFICYFTQLGLICLVPLVATLWLGLDSLDLALNRLLTFVFFIPLTTTSSIVLIGGNFLYESILIRKSKSEENP